MSKKTEFERAIELVERETGLRVTVRHGCEAEVLINGYYLRWFTNFQGRINRVYDEPVNNPHRPEFDNFTRTGYRTIRAGLRAVLRLHKVSHIGEQGRAGAKEVSVRLGYGKGNGLKRELSIYVVRLVGRIEYWSSGEYHRLERSAWISEKNDDETWHMAIQFCAGRLPVEIFLDWLLIHRDQDARLDRLLALPEIVEEMNRG